MDEKHKFNSDIEGAVLKVVHDKEYNRQKADDNVRTTEFQSIVRMFENEHDEKDYDWMSDVSLPELPSIILTDASMWANQYFQTRDFVEVRLEGDEPHDEDKCRAAKKVLNKTLNRKNLYHYPKFIRARTINALNSSVWIVAWWEQEIKQEIRGYRKEIELLDVDEMGNEITDETTQRRAKKINDVPIWGEGILKDHFNYEVVDPRNVTCDNKYAYSPQTKEWITIRSEKSYEEIKAREDVDGYFNLDVLKDWAKNGQLRVTDFARETVQQYTQSQKPTSETVRQFDVLTRFGKFWAIVKNRTEDGRPTKIVPGYDEDGEISDKAEYIECIIAWASNGNGKLLIRFQPTPYYTKRGETYRPLARGLCYIHPTDDKGLGDGKLLRPIAKAINDTYNLSADRTLLSTIPTLIGVEDSVADNPTVRIAPENIIEVKERGAIEPLKIEANTEAALNQIQLLISKGQQVTSVYPTTMGEVGQASTTATAIAGADARSNMRSNYKSLTFEYTFLIEFYWLLLQMFWQFAQIDTALKIMGPDAEFFDPDADYTYQPVSSNIEMEYNKYKKIQNWDQILGRVVNIQHPDTVKMINYIVGKVCELMGDEYALFSKAMLNPDVPIQTKNAQAEQGMVPGGQPEMMSNQNNVPMLLPEQFARGV
jgi:hypothetical protein